MTNITIPSETIAQFFQRYHIQKLSFFGSVLRADFSPESDIDILKVFIREVLTRAEYDKNYWKKDNWYQ